MTLLAREYGPNARTPRAGYETRRDGSVTPPFVYTAAQQEHNVVGDEPQVCPLEERSRQSVTSLWLLRFAWFQDHALPEFQHDTCIFPAKPTEGPTQAYSIGELCRYKAATVSKSRCSVRGVRMVARS